MAHEDEAKRAREERTHSMQAARRAWTQPAVEELPRLRELTLQTGSPIPGGGGPGGGVF